jgi:hypothetical protein
MPGDGLSEYPEGAAVSEVSRARKGVEVKFRMLIEPGSYWLLHRNQGYKLFFQLCSPRWVSCISRNMYIDPSTATVRGTLN